MNNTHTESEKIAVADIVPVQLINVADIVPDPKNQGRNDPAALARLAKSIGTDGLLQPVILRPNTDPLGERYMLIAGERRWRAHGILGRAKIEARVYSSEEQLASVRKRAIENLDRENLNPIQEARQYAELIESGMSQSEAAERAGVDQSTMSNRLRVLKLPVAVQAHIEAGTLSRAHGVALVAWAKWPAVCARMADFAIEEESTSKDLEGSDLPFQWGLSSEGLIERLYCYKGGDYTITKAMREDGDWIIKGDTATCMDGAKGKAERARQNNAKSVAAAKVAGGGKAGGLTAEQKARRDKIAKNKAARARVDAALRAVTESVRDRRPEPAGLLRVGGEEVGAVVAAALGNLEGGLGKAAEELGLKIKQTGRYGVSAADVMALGWVDALRVCALAVCNERAKEALRNAGEVPEIVVGMMGPKTKQRMEALLAPPAEPESVPLPKEVAKFLKGKLAKAKPAKAGKKGGKK